MPTHDEISRFLRDFRALSVDKRVRFLQTLPAFREDVARGSFRAGLRVKRVRTGPGAEVWEMTWAPDGRATFQYGPEVLAGHRHVVWRRIGSHDIFLDP